MIAAADWGWPAARARGKAAIMSDRNDPQAGGIFLLAAIAAGAVIGTMRGQPTIGVLAGTGIGILLALVFWLRDRRRD